MARPCRPRGLKIRRSRDGIVKLTGISLRPESGEKKRGRKFRVLPRYGLLTCDGDDVVTRITHNVAAVFDVAAANDRGDRTSS